MRKNLDYLVTLKNGNKKHIKIFLRTSYFYNLRFFDTNIMFPVSICIWDPKWYKSRKEGAMTYKGLIPRKYDSENDCEACAKKFKKDDPLYNGNLQCNYVNNYRKQLSYYNFERTINDILKKSDIIYNFQEILHKNPNITSFYIIFMGYEVPEKLCSERFILSEWIRDKGNIEIKEMEFKKE